MLQIDIVKKEMIKTSLNAVAAIHVGSIQNNVSSSANPEFFSYKFYSKEQK